MKKLFFALSVTLAINHSHAGEDVDLVAVKIYHQNRYQQLESHQPFLYFNPQDITPLIPSILASGFMFQLLTKRSSFTLQKKLAVATLLLSMSFCLKNKISNQ